MKTSINDIFNQAKRFIAGDMSGNCPFPDQFLFASRGRPAYELVLDASGSMNCEDYPPSRFAAAKQAATGFMEKCAMQTPEALAGVIFYSDQAYIASPLLPVKEHLPRMRRAVETGEIVSRTNIGSGLIAAGKELMAKGASLSPVIVLLTDGHSNEGSDPVGTALRLKEMGVRLDIIGIGGSPDDVNEHQLKQMASVYDGQLRYWFIRNTPTLVRKFEALALGKL